MQHLINGQFAALYALGFQIDTYLPPEKVLTSEVTVEEMTGELPLFEALERERNLQRAMLEVRRRFGMNAIVKGMNLLEGATTIERNTQIGGHRAGGALPGEELGRKEKESGIRQ